ncbi:nose resistant to fluoxetine protein 6-like [Aphis craccivora]|uniref:Nose resistant to fluoxetine protein 6-like n=1 Tax=Aphis craccivora TaxID=307492 RepID=A0A6G0ZLK4_APHCR|nr:nose resistant to fluoxetine protein 6-like [Aphis craccivora]
MQSKQIRIRFLSIRLLTVYFRYVYFPAARVVQDDDVCSNAVTITQRKMSKSRFTDVITSCRLMIIVALIGSYDNCNYCRAVQSVTAADYLPYVRQDDFRPRDGGVDDFRPDRLHYGGSFAIPVVDNGNRTHVQRLLRRTSDMASKFLPFVTSADVHTQCYKHTAVYLTQLNDFQLWATQMFDASAKFISTGWFDGSTYNLGNFDECVNVEVFERDDYIQGQYCLVEIEINPIAHSKFRSRKHDLAFDPNKSMRNKIYIAYCVPHTCNSGDVSKHMEGILREIPQQKITTSVGAVKCQTNTALPWTWGDYTFLSIIGFSFIFIGVSTYYDLFTSMSSFEHFQFSEKSKKHLILQSFSLSKNVRKLLTFPKTSDNLECIHGLKFISMCFIIVGHRFMFTLGSPIMNSNFIEYFYSKIEAMVILNGPILVDTFFIISGFLACYLLLEHIQKNPKAFQIPLFYIHRYVRLTPVYAIVIGFYCTMFIKIGTGPLWNEKVGSEVERCHESWWTNILYINNYIKPQKLCMIQSWYIACDTHLFLTAPIIVSLLYHKPKIGNLVLALILIATISTTFFVTYLGKLDAFLLVHIKTLRNPITDKTFRSLYIPTHTRATPYYVGMMTGLVRHKMKNSSYKINKYVVWSSWIVSIVLMFGTLFSAWWFYEPNYKYDAFVAALYGALYRITWAAGVSWTIIAVSTGNGGFIEPILCWKPVITLSRLTYCAFLCHGGLQLYTVGSIRTPFHTSYYNLVWLSFGDITLSFLAAFCLTLLYESPIIGLEKIFFNPVFLSIEILEQ